MAMHWENYKFLIVDDIEEFCATLRGMLKLCGAQDIDVAHDGFEAIKKIKLNKSRPYDLVLCDYKLTDGKDGLQVLEQIRQEKLLKAASVFIIVSSVSGSELVMAAMENQPDDYIMKPFNQAMLQQRLERTFKRRLDLSPIYYAIDGGQTDVALALCDQVKKLQPKYTPVCDRIKAELYLEKGDHGAAQEIYMNQLRIRSVPWAAFGLARTQIIQQKWEDAQKTLREIIEQSPVFLKAYDALAELECRLKNYTAAKAVLQQALHISPRVAGRQANLGRVAYDTGDFEAAESAFREAVRLNKYATHKSSEHYVKLAKCLFKQITELGDPTVDPVKPGEFSRDKIRDKDKKEQIKKRKTEELFGTLKEIRQEFKAEKDVILDATLLAGKTYVALERMPEARAAVDAAYSAFQKMAAECPEDIKLSMVESLAAVGEKREAQNLALELMKAGDTSLNMSLQAVLDNSDYNSEGIAAYQRKQYAEAIRLFECALQTNPDSVSFHLNYIQAMMQFLKEKAGDPPVGWWARVQTSFQQVGQLPPGDPRYSRFLELHTWFQAVPVPPTFAVDEKSP